MKVIAVDAKNAAFRFTWAYRALTDDAGNPTGAVYGLLRMLIGLKKKYPDARFVFVWDGQRTEKNWRNRIYPGYKQRRGTIPKTVTDVLSQIPKMEEALQATGIPSIGRVPDVEADDLIGMFTTVCLKEDWHPIIYSSDMDYAQLLQYGIDIIRGSDTKQPFRLTQAREICERFGCSIENVLRVRALMGDQSDKIPKPMRGLGIEIATRMIADGLIDPARMQEIGRNQYAEFLRIPKLGRKRWALIADNASSFCADVRRNYQLMRIVRSWNDPVYAPQRHAIKVQLQYARQRIKSPDEVDGDELTRFLVDGQYVSLMRERKLLMRLNSI